MLQGAVSLVCVQSLPYLLDADLDYHFMGGYSGINCTPIDILGIGQNSCAEMPLCCTDQTFVSGASLKKFASARDEWADGLWSQERPHRYWVCTNQYQPLRPVGECVEDDGQMKYLLLLFTWIAYRSYAEGMFIWYFLRVWKSSTALNIMGWHLLFGAKEHDMEDCKFM